MKLHEYQSKDVLSRFGVPVPRGSVTRDATEAKQIAESLGGKVVVKAQVLMGGRGKAGGVQLFDNATDAGTFTKELIGKKLVSIQNPAGMVVEQVLVAEQIDIAEEYYLSVLVDRSIAQLVVMISSKGGMDIEEVAHSDPDAIFRLAVDPCWGLCDYEVRRAVKVAKIPKLAQSQMVQMIKKLVRVFLEMDADLIEVNPVALTPDGRLLAADAKISIDDNALFRHSEFAHSASDSAEDPIEAEAAKRGIAYVRLGGEVGIMGNGAGLVMCSIDEVSQAGGKAANFLDVGGGAQAERVRHCVELIAMDQNVKGLLINIFGGITRGDEVAKGLIEAFDTIQFNMPIVARIEGTGAAEGLALLKDTKIIPASTMQEAAAKIVQLTR